MQLSKAVDGYAISSLAEGYSPLTLNTYKSALFTMIEYLGDKDVSKVTTEDLKGFMSYLVTGHTPERRNNPQNTERLSTASHHRYWKAMRSFFKWANKDLSVGRPDAPIKMPKWENKEITALTKSEVEALLKACEYANVSSRNRKLYKFRKPNALRNRAIILTLLETGVRVGELTRLRVGDVDLENGEVFVRPFHVGKTHSRTTYLGKTGRKAVWHYLANRGDCRQDDPLFVTDEDQPMTRQRVLAMLNRLGKSANIKSVHPHRFRHTCAIEYLRNGGDIFTLKALLGHKRMNMVDRYLEIARADVQNAHRKASPADNWRL
jgi:integrase/recombinase XerD